ncbi:hypothetical protein OUZ56_005292 [Daphnia magna]|uniref:Uncharacterized protein n=1 Tax=Daphnia magna TaxID=35525 RepID=A0ABQ9YSE2_9CRUS|nr:hypothetical protein OUZ56_005292 [Daphnia magna]
MATFQEYIQQNEDSDGRLEATRLVVNLACLYTPLRREVKLICISNRFAYTQNSYLGIHHEGPYKPEFLRLSATLQQRFED